MINFFKEKNIARQIKIEEMINRDKKEYESDEKMLNGPLDFNDYKNWSKKNKFINIFFYNFDFERFENILNSPFDPKGFFIEFLKFSHRFYREPKNIIIFILSCLFYIIFTVFFWASSIAFLYYFLYILDHFTNIREKELTFVYTVVTIFYYLMFFLYIWNLKPRLKSIPEKKYKAIPYLSRTWRENCLSNITFWLFINFFKKNKYIFILYKLNDIKYSYLSERIYLFYESLCWRWFLEFTEFKDKKWIENMKETKLINEMKLMNLKDLKKLKKSINTNKVKWTSQSISVVFMYWFAKENFSPFLALLSTIIISATAGLLYFS